MYRIGETVTLTTTESSNTTEKLTSPDPIPVMDFSPSDNGYIFQLREKPLVEAMEESGNGKVKYVQMRRLSSEHDRFLDEATRKLRKKNRNSKKYRKKADLPIYAEYFKVLNGVVLAVGAEDAKRIAKSQYVKAVYPKYPHVHVSLRFGSAHWSGRSVVL